MPFLAPFSFLRGIAPVVLPNNVSGLILWLKADTLGLSDGASVATWTAAAGTNAVQATGGNQPVFKTAILNSKPVIRFNGTTSFMTVASLAKGAFSAFYVYKATAGGILVEHGVNGGTNPGDYHYVPGAAHFSAYGTNQSAFDLSAPSLATGTWYTVSRKMGGTHATHLAWVNGVAGTRVNDGSTGFDPGTGVTTATYYIGSRSGGSLWTSCDIAEIIIYDNSISNVNRAGVEQYLRNKYAHY